MDKQDCERKAFIRLSERLKKDYPRLPVLIPADGLYPYEGVFEICRTNGWQYFFTFRDGNLKSVWEQVDDALMEKTENEKTHFLSRQKEYVLQQKIRWVNDITYRSFTLNWIECVETETKKGQTKQTRFVHLSSIPVDDDSAVQISRHARMRWKIENEGFNSQKNRGYNLEHKFSGVNFTATQNYYQCLQIAHMINQLAEYEISFQKKLLQKDAFDTVWSWLNAALMMDVFDDVFVSEIFNSNCLMKIETYMILSELLKMGIFRVFFYFNFVIKKSVVSLQIFSSNYCE
jgi:hypothetical protein